MKLPVFALALMALAAASLACNLTDEAPPATPPDAEGGSAGPIVVIDSPPSGTEVNAGEEVVVQSTSSDLEGVTRVDLLVNGENFASNTTPNSTSQNQFSLIQSWTPQTGGEYTVTVVAYRADGSSGEGASITLFVLEEPPEEVVESSGCELIANVNLNVRSGDGTGFGVLGNLLAGERAPVSGRNNGDTWTEIVYEGRYGWVSNPFVNRTGDCNQIPLAESPPTPISGGSVEPATTEEP